MDSGNDEPHSSLEPPPPPSPLMDFGAISSAPATGFSLLLPLPLEPVGGPIVGEVADLGSGLIPALESSRVGIFPFSASSSSLSPKVSRESGGFREGDTGVPHPLEALQGVPIPPFLSKTYDLVEDPALDQVISWGPGGASFVVWDPVEFSRAILPQHFKHNNFSSFVRQLNTYGFRKIDTDRWEFANEYFLRGKRNMLKNIHRRKSSLLQLRIPGCGSSVEPGRMGNEVEKLKIERNSLMQEVVKLQQKHQVTAQQVDAMSQRLKVAEGRQQQMLAFMAKVLQNPAFLSRLQGLEEQMIISSGGKRKFLNQNEAGPSKLNPYMEGQLMRYGTGCSDPTTSQVDQPELDTTTGEQVSGYLLQDLVGTLELDGDDSMQRQTGMVKSSEQLQELADVSGYAGVRSRDFPLLETISSSNADYFVSFPDDLSPEKISPPVFMMPGSENIVKQEEIWNLEMCFSHPSSSQDMWGSIFSSEVQEADLVAELGDLWELGPRQADENLGIDNLMGEPTFDDLDSTQAEELKDDTSKEIVRFSSAEAGYWQLL